VNSEFTLVLNIQFRFPDRSKDVDVQSGPRFETSIYHRCKSYYARPFHLDPQPGLPTIPTPILIIRPNHQHLPILLARKLQNNSLRRRRLAKLGDFLDVQTDPTNIQFDPLGDSDGGGIGVFVGGGVEREGEEAAGGEGEGTGLGGVEDAGAGGDLLADREALHVIREGRRYWQ